MTSITDIQVEVSCDYCSNPAISRRIKDRDEVGCACAVEQICQDHE